MRDIIGKLQYLCMASETLTKFYPPLKENQIQKMVNETKYEIPKEYQEFLRCTNGVSKLWNKYFLLGYQQNPKGEHFINVVRNRTAMEVQKKFNVKSIQHMHTQQIEKKVIQFYFPHYYIFGGDYKSQIMFFNPYNKDVHGYSEVVMWDMDNGYKKTFKNLYEFLSFILAKLSVA